MAMTMRTEGLEEAEAMLSRLGESAGAVAAYGLYDGAGIMADAINAQAAAIRTEGFHYAALPGVTMRLPSPEEKAALMSAGAGIAKFEKNGGEVGTSVGFGNAGYAEVNGKTKPVPQIANAINSGTSFMKAQPFFRRGVNSGRGAAVDAIGKAIEAKCDEIIKQSGG